MGENVDTFGYVTKMCNGMNVCRFYVGVETKPLVTCEGQATPLLPPSH